MRQRVIALETQFNGGKMGAASKVEVVTNSAWRKLAASMNEEQVIKLLG